MVALKQVSFDSSVYCCYLSIFDAKVNMLDSFQSFKVTKSLREGEQVTSMDTVFNEKLFCIINHLPDDELQSLSRLIACRQCKYI